MPDATEHALPYVEHDGIRFGKLSVSDRTKLLRTFKQQKKDAKREDVKVLSPEQAYTELATLEGSIWGAQRFMLYLNEFDGQEAVFRAGLAKQNPAEKVDAILGDLMLTPEESIKLACEVACFPYTPAAPQVPNMVQVGVVNGRPVYAIAEGAEETNQQQDQQGGDEAHPTQETRPKGYGQ